MTFERTRFELSNRKREENRLTDRDTYFINRRGLLITGRGYVNSDVFYVFVQTNIVLSFSVFPEGLKVRYRSKQRIKSYKKI